jgi:hypothetical protein
MPANPLSKGVLSENFAGIGPVSRKMVQDRARELALIGGRALSGVTQADYEQAKRELTGESDLDKQETMLESLPEEMRDPSPASAGRQVPDAPNEDEDEEGRSEEELIVEQGVNEAEHDQMLQAARKAGKEDRRES